MAEQAFCDGCGAEVERTPRGWARKKDFGDDLAGWDYCCQVLYDTSGKTAAFRVLGADYHFVKGEKQRHFRPDGAQHSR